MAPQQKKLLTVPFLLSLSKPQLDELWSDTEAGETPLGVFDGTAIVTPSKQTINRALARHIKTFAWQGKTFVPGALTNRIAGLDIIAATVYRGPSIYDALECIILDYAITPLVEKLRDEIRQIGPEMYLGKAYRNRKELIYFALERAGPISPGARATATLSSSPTT